MLGVVFFISVCFWRSEKQFLAKFFYNQSKMLTALNQILKIILIHSFFAKI